MYPALDKPINMFCLPPTFVVFTRMYVFRCRGWKNGRRRQQRRETETTFRQNGVQTERKETREGQGDV
jgi:hypothetical protein